jgi:hypothetical protein
MRIDSAVPWAFTEHNSGITVSECRNFQKFPYTYSRNDCRLTVSSPSKTREELEKHATYSVRLISFSISLRYRILVLITSL